MSAPEYVPTISSSSKSYRSPDVVPETWSGDRPGSVGTDQPIGPALGNQGPDQGYALKLGHQFDDRLVLRAGEHRADVMAGAVEIAMKRASVYGRAPVVHDLEIALRVWGFLDDASEELVAVRRCFEGAANPHHWRDLRAIVARVPVSTLRCSPSEVSSAHSADWCSLLSMD